jgi:hypothetical protein
MHDPLSMRRGQGLRDLHRQPQRVGDRHGPFRVSPSTYSITR